MANTLSTLYVDVVQRGLKEVMDGLKAVTGQADRGTQSIRQMKAVLQEAGRASGSLGGGDGGGAGRKNKGGLDIGGMISRYAGPAAVGAGALAGVRAADPGVFEQLGVVLHDLAGTVGQVLAPAFRAVLPVVRQVANVVAGLADVFKPVVSTIVGQVVPVVNQLVAAWAGVVGQVGGMLLPVVKQLAPLLAPIAQLFVTLYQAVAPLGVALLKMQFTLLSVWAAVIGAVLPVIQVFAEVLKGVATVFAEVFGLFADVVGSLLSVVGELLSPLRDLVAMFAGALVQGLRMAVSGFRMLVDSVRALFGLRRATVGDGNSVGRGMTNDTGTEDANSTFQRIQQAILKAGVGEEKGTEEKMAEDMAELRKKAEEFFKEALQWIRERKKDAESAGNLAEGAKVGGAGGLAFELGRMFGGGR